MPIAHSVVSGMGGMRTAGDLVARMQFARRMRISEAKAYVADRLKVGVHDLSDTAIMREVREDLGLGVILGVPGDPKGMEAKERISEVLDIRINCVERSRRRAEAWKTQGRNP